MPKVLVLFSSRTGNTAKLADAIVEGARSVRFTEVDVRRIDDLASESVVDAVPAWRESRESLRRRYRTLGAVDELADYDALVLGAPTRHGVMAAELSALLDQLGALGAGGRLVDRVGSAFTTVQTPHGGQETTLWSIMTPMASVGMILVPSGYASAATLAGGSPLGVAASAGPNDAPIPDAALAAARHQGARVATVTAMVAHVKGHEHGHHHHPHHH